MLCLGRVKASGTDVAWASLWPLSHPRLSWLAPKIGHATIQHGGGNWQQSSPVGRDSSEERGRVGHFPSLRFSIREVEFNLLADLWWGNSFLLCLFRLPWHPPMPALAAPFCCQALGMELSEDQWWSLSRCTHVLRRAPGVLCRASSPCRGDLRLPGFCSFFGILALE